MKQHTKLLIIGDVVGNPGRSMFQKYVPKLKHQHAIDGVIVNGENSSSTGRGITSRIVHAFKHNGADMVTSGNHIFAQKEVYAYLDTKTNLLRPANFPTATPGTGIGFFTTSSGITVGVINIQGRVFMRELLACPFKTLESALLYVKTKTPIIVVDIHAETTAEKMGIAHFIDGTVSAVVGTHTHVQTSDERILPGGTAFITDLGMVGSLNGMLGMKKEPILHNLITQMPIKFAVDDSMPLILCGVIVVVDNSNGKAISIERIRIVDSDVMIVHEEDKEHR